MAMFSSLSRGLLSRPFQKPNPKSLLASVRFCSTPLSCSEPKHQPEPESESEPGPGHKSEEESEPISEPSPNPIPKQMPFTRVLENGLDPGVYKAIMVGKVGQKPMQKQLRSGRTVVLFSLGTGGIRNNRRPLDNEEPREYAERCSVQWHRVSVYMERLGDLALRHVKPGSILYLEGNLETKVFSDPITGLVRRIREIALRRDGQYADLVTRMTNFQNEDKGLLVLAGDVFDVPIRKDIIHRVVRWQLAKRQQGTHSTKTISEVSGTGRKPYKQKGTGRARHGTLRGPQFRGGAVMHGPKPRSHAFKLNKKVRRLGLKIALSARAAEGKLLVFENLEVPNHKTKNIVNYVSQMENTKKVLLVDGGPLNDNLKLATGNLHYVNILPSIGLNVYSILQHDTLVMTRDAIDRIVTRMHTPINR